MTPLLTQPQKIALISAGTLLALALILLIIFTRFGEPLPKKISDYKKIIMNTADIKEDEYPLRHFLSESSIARIRFRDPDMLNGKTDTVIIVLGDRPLDRTTPTVNMVYRVLKGIQLSKKYLGSVLIMSGGTTAGDISEAEMMGLIAWSRGMNPARIILEDRSRNTSQNAEFTERIIRSKGIRNKFIITDRSRLDLAVRVFRSYFREFKDVVGVDCGVPVKLIFEQMQKYLNVRNDRVVLRRLRQLKSELNSDDYKNIYGASDDAKIILNSSIIRNIEFPLIDGISDNTIEKISFLSPDRIKDNTGTAVFVLPNRPLDGTTPSIDTVYRTLKAVGLSREFNGSILVMLGPKSIGEVSDARMMALVAWSRGVDAARIVLEDKARSIEDKVEFISRTIKAKKIKQAFVVTKKEHLSKVQQAMQEREETKNIPVVDCGVTKALIIGQMEDYLKFNDDTFIRRRIDNIKK